MSGLIDVHSHFVTPRYIEAAIRAGHEHPEGMPRWASWSEEEHLALMDKAGIELTVLSISSPGVHFGDDEAARRLAWEVNEFAAGLTRRRPDRFAHFGSLPLPDVAGSLAEIGHTLDVLGSDGVAVLTNAHGIYLGDRRYDEVYAELNRRAATVFVHPVSPPNWTSVALGRPRPMLEFIFDSTRAAVDLVLNGVLDDFPRINWIFSHSGGALPVLAERIQLFGDLMPGVRLRRPVLDQLAGLWYDIAGTPFPHAAPALVRAVGRDRVLYGSDYCWTPAEGALAQADSVDQQWRALTRHNATTLLARSPAG